MVLDDFLFAKIGIFYKSMADSLPSGHELSVTIHEISTFGEKKLDAGHFTFVYDE